MDAQLQAAVRRRAQGRCEYCLFPEALARLPFQIDHIIARKHGGVASPDNLAWSCLYCNSYKGSNLSGIDPDTGALVRLFHPRKDAWTEHFRWEVALLVGRTPIGRATIEVLRINDPDAIAVRASLIQEGVFPQS